ncbi:MAG: DUF1801 domain-containing protein [Woeseiaceae bacterium]
MKEAIPENVNKQFQNYPPAIRSKLVSLRELLMEVIQDTPGIEGFEETLKWGEPSYLVKGGSTVRIGWQRKQPEHYAMYFNCNTILVDTFKELYVGLFTFEANRAIVFHQDDVVPATALKHCISLALRYHALKKLPLLGA